MMELFPIILAASTYNSIYGFHNDREYKGVEREELDQEGHVTAWREDNNAAFAKASGQDFYRYYVEDFDGKLSGYMNAPLIGLTPNTTYTNNATQAGAGGSMGGSTSSETGDMGGSWAGGAGGSSIDWSKRVPTFANQDVLASVTRGLLEEGVHTKTSVDIRQLVLHAQPIYKDANTIAGGWSSDDYIKPVPDFTTKGEEQPVATLPDATDTKLEVANDAVTPGQTARVYVNNLKDEAKGKADANSLFWYAYIYSTPKALTSPNGAPFVRVQKEDTTGRYYFDAVVPSDLPAGSHRISLQDENGAVQAVTAVTAGDAVAPAADKTALNNAINAAGNLTQKDYTADSWTGFAKALEAAKSVAAKQDASQTDVNAAVKTLTDAQAGLKKYETVAKSDSDKSAKDKKAKKDENSKLANTGSSVAAIASVFVALLVAGAGFTVTRKIRS